jgi:redox-sensitive bicupin YhaK (pirin superfamily)
MTAGRGIIHSEMPQQESGRMRGFQLWINLPAKEKMKPAGYRDIQAEDIPVATLSNGATIKVVAGILESDGQTVAGAIQGVSTAPLFLDVHLPAGATFVQPVGLAHNAFVYPYEGSVSIADAVVPRGDAGVLIGGDKAGDVIEVTAGAEEARFIVLAALPLNEPIVQYGPFVMNSREEIEQALRDYSDGSFAQAA